MEDLAIKVLTDCYDTCLDWERHVIPVHGGISILAGTVTGFSQNSINTYSPVYEMAPYCTTFWMIGQMGEHCARSSRLFALARYHETMVREHWDNM